MTFRYRNWCLTSFKILNEADFTAILTKAARIKFSNFQFEKCPDTGRLHLQAFVIYRNIVSIKGIKEDFGSDIHAEACKGSIQQNIDYTSKDESRVFGPFQWGEIPKNGNKKDETSRRIIELAKSGDVATIQDEYPGQYLRYKRTIQEIAREEAHCMERFKPRGIWLFGPAGSGKTTYVAKQNAYFKGPNKWFDGYAGERIILLDDMRSGDWTFLEHYIKRWADSFPCTGEIKGAHVKLNHDWLIITSNQSLEESIKDLHLCHHAAILRRFTSISTQSKDWVDVLDRLIQ